MAWTGPQEVVGAVNSFVCEVQPGQGKRKPAVVHVVRMRQFANARLGTPGNATAIELAALHDYPEKQSGTAIARSPNGERRIEN